MKVGRGGVRSALFVIFGRRKWGKILVRQGRGWYNGLIIDPADFYMERENQHDLS